MTSTNTLYTHGSGHLGIVDEDGDRGVFPDAFDRHYRKVEA